MLSFFSTSISARTAVGTDPIATAAASVVSFIFFIACDLIVVLLSAEQRIIHGSEKPRPCLPKSPANPRTTRRLSLRTGEFETPAQKIRKVQSRFQWPRRSLFSSFRSCQNGETPAPAQVRHRQSRTTERPG